jgi:hypothetical protein
MSKTLDNAKHYSVQMNQQLSQSFRETMLLLLSRWGEYESVELVR